MTVSRQVVRAFHSTLRWQRQFFNANNEMFEKAVAAPDRVVLVDFYASWCRPCQMLSPILEKLTKDGSAKSGSGRSLDLVTVDTDAEFDLSHKYNIRAMPTVIAFKNGKPVDQFTGALNEAGVRHFLSKV